MHKEASISGATFLEWWRMLPALVLTGTISGSMSALFLVTLDMVSAWHAQNSWLLLLLPLAGVAIVWFYQKYGDLAHQGSHLLVEEIHELQDKVPFRMAPMVLITTLVTHLYGGSAGREGTAVQMGGAVAGGISRVFLRSPFQKRTLLIAGIAAGFGAVFGTPWAGAVFAVELPVRGRWHVRYLLPALLASGIGHCTCLWWGVHHTDYRALGLTQEGFREMNLTLIGYAAVAAIAFGLCGRLFVRLAHAAPDWFARLSPRPLLRPLVGGTLVIVLVSVLGTADYLGLGVVSPREGGISILSSFTRGGADPWSWWWKMIFTIVTLSSGFKGGEVTPLFFIGAALGNTVAILTGQPVEVFAGMGMLAVFAAAANTPLACTILGMELFGTHYTALFALACLISFLVSGRAGIYRHQM